MIVDDLPRLLVLREWDDAISLKTSSIEDGRGRGFRILIFSVTLCMDASQCSQGGSLRAGCESTRTYSLTGRSQLMLGEVLRFPKDGRTFSFGLRLPNDGRTFSFGYHFRADIFVQEGMGGYILLLLIATFDRLEVGSNNSQPRYTRAPHGTLYCRALLWFSFSRDPGNALRAMPQLKDMFGGEADGWYQPHKLLSISLEVYHVEV